jgi:glycerophosphoryl diester phosphodiesterase
MTNISIMAANRKGAIPLRPAALTANSRTLFSFTPHSSPDHSGPKATVVAYDRASSLSSFLFRRLPWEKVTHVLAIAHRGASGYAPENTLAAFRRAVAQGVSFIETDLHLTRDAHFVAIHDETVERTTNGKGPVQSMTLAEIRRLDAGSWFASEFMSERIPLLDDVLEFARKNDVVFYLELKPSGFWGGEHALISQLRNSVEIARSVIISFDPVILASLRKIEPTLMTGLLHDGKLANPFDKALEIGARQLAVRGDLVTPKFLQQARSLDLQVVCWTVNSPAHMRMLIAAGVDGIMSDYPDRLLSVLKK